MNDIGNFAIKIAEQFGCSYAEARTESSEGNAFILKNGNPEVSGFEASEGIAVRLLKNKNLTFVSTNKLEKENIKWLIRKAVRRLDSSSRLSEKIELKNERVNKKNYKVRQKINVLDFSPKEKLDLLLEVEKSLDEIKKNIPARYFSIADSLTKKEIITSEGTMITSEIPRINFVYVLTMVNSQKSAQRYWQLGASSGMEILNKWKLEKKLKEESAALLRNLRQGRKTRPGAYDVVVAPEVAGIIAHESCGHPYEADRILGREAAQAGESFVKKDDIGNEMSSKNVSVVDYPAMEGSYGFYLYDDEGVLGKKKYLVKNGIMNEFLHNRETSAAMRMANNGSSRATSYEREAIVRMSNTFFVPGKTKEEELISEVKRGIYIKNFTEWNIDDKRLNQKYVGSEAYIIENGEITHPVINPTIEIDTIRLYASIDNVADNFELHAATCGKGEPMQGIPVTMGGPSIRLRRIKIT
ncbi:TldD/PmbA family protein [Candidatus Woesearchaeota archaeon]|nr:TldD/PmbA family protein [Candidatus Woesearchaeota archaeon]